MRITPWWSSINATTLVTSGTANSSCFSGALFAHSGIIETLIAMDTTKMRTTQSAIKSRPNTKWHPTCWQPTGTSSPNQSKQNWRKWAVAKTCSAHHQAQPAWCHRHTQMNTWSHYQVLQLQGIRHYNTKWKRLGDAWTSLMPQPIHCQLVPHDKA